MGPWLGVPLCMSGIHYSEFGHTRLQKHGRYLRDDGITVGAQASHSGGNPMSQHTKTGFNAPGFPVAAGNEDGVIPGASATCWLNGIPESCGLGGRLPLRPSWAVGDTHPARFIACSLSGRLFLFIVSSLALPSRQSRLAGVAHPIRSI